MIHRCCYFPSVNHNVELVLNPSNEASDTSSEPDVFDLDQWVGVRDNEDGHSLVVQAPEGERQIADEVVRDDEDGQPALEGERGSVEEDAIAFRRHGLAQLLARRWAVPEGDGPHAAHRQLESTTERQVDAILKRSACIPARGQPSRLFSLPHFYPVWGTSLLGTVLGTSLGGTDLALNSGKPEEGLIGLSVNVAMLGQGGDSKITYDGISAAFIQQAQQQAACRNYLNAAVGLKALAELESRLETQRYPLNGQARAQFLNARQQLQAQANEHYPTFASCLSRGYMAARCWAAGIRDVGLGAIGLAKTVPASVVGGLSASGPLSSSAQALATTMSYLSGSLGMATGMLSILQGVWEGMDAHRDQQALEQAEDFDKKAFASFDVRGEHLQTLMEYRHQQRDMARLGAGLLRKHAWIRGSFGVTSLGVGVTATTLSALGGAAVFGAIGMGIPSLLGVAAAVGYMLWFSARVNLLLAAQKRHDKAQQTLTVNQHVGRDRIPGLSEKAWRPSMEVVANTLLKNLNPNNRDTLTTQELLPVPNIDSTEHDNALRLAKLGLSGHGLAVLETDALRALFARKSASAQDKLSALWLWMGRGEKAVDIATPSLQTDKHWSHYLAPGRDMADLRKSALKLKHVIRYWDDLAFQGWMKALQASENGPPPQTPQDAWTLLTRCREEMQLEQTAVEKVEGWVRKGLFDHIQMCLGEQEPQGLLYRQVLQTRYQVNASRRDDVVAAFREHAIGVPLRTDTIEHFMAVCRASNLAEKLVLLPVVQQLVDATLGSVPIEDGDQFCDALGLSIQREGVIEPVVTPVSARNVDAVLTKLQKFLWVSEKLRGQILSKVVASLHMYPTDKDIPKVLCRVAALRELRLRCETAGRTLDEPDVEQALVLAKSLSGEKLHGRGVGTGEGGGVLGFGGYVLNDKGRFVRALFEHCMGQRPTLSGLSESALKRIWQQCSDSGSREALMHWANALIGIESAIPLTAGKEEFAQTFCWHQTPAALTKALRSSRQEAAKRCLGAKLVAVQTALQVSATPLNDPQGAPTFDAARFIEQLQEFFRLETLARKHKLVPPTLELGVALQPRLGFYRAALGWKNKTAQRKNIQALHWELGGLRARQNVGNSFWSNKFLASQGDQGKAEALLLQKRYPWLGNDVSYKDMVNTLRALDALTLPKLHKAILTKVATGRQWVLLQFTIAGCPLPPGTDSIMETLHEAAKKGEPQLLEAVVSLLEDTLVRQFSQAQAESGVPMQPLYKVISPGLEQEIQRP